ncbi:MAG: AAA family ATPase [Pyrinomonadaceae bacterium]
MLIRFKVANFLSFKEETEFSMVAGRERLHPNHVVKGGKNQPNLLRSALLYGANAAGKSNFAKAIEFAKNFITSGKFAFLFGSDTANWFRFDDNYRHYSTDLMFEFFTEGKIYEYNFRILFVNLEGCSVIEEILIEVRGDKRILLFKRNLDDKGNNIFSETNFLDKDSDKEFLVFVQRSVSQDELFLTHCAENNVDWFLDAFKWFKNSLHVIFPNIPDYEISKRISANDTFKEYFINLLERAGTGISDVKVRQVKSKNILGGWLSSNNTRRLTSEYITTDKIEILHEQKYKDVIPLFKKEEESDGTQRLFDLAFPFYDLASSETPNVYIIDELERNLHTNLSHMLLKSYLEQDGKGQLIATTHDTHLLDLDLLRRDEIWFAEKDEHGATQLYSLYDFNPRYDKDIEKDYLLGRYGAIPFLGNLEFKRKLGKESKNGKSKK